MILSIDVEDWFHIVGAGADHQFKSPTGGVDSWRDFSPRIEMSTHWILDTLDRHHTRATFFILGWIAEKHPHLVREIHSRGHEIASHSYWHKLVYIQTRSEFLEDLRRSVHVLENITGKKVLGYRASSASITPWALDCLANEGLFYDSSFYPATYHDLYAKIDGLDASKPIEQFPNGLWEVKMSSLRLQKIRMPWGGGGYFRLIPYKFFLRGVHRIIRDQGLYLFYIHPWELDPDAPRLNDLKKFYFHRRYHSIEKSRTRFESFLDTFRFVTVEDALFDWIKSHDEGNDKPRHLAVAGSSTIVSGQRPRGGSCLSTASIR
jgi:polysaccharide deacetylase family protein (PEP-CTERM system associated)